MTRRAALVASAALLATLALACFNPPPAASPQTCGNEPVYEVRDGRKVQTGTRYACEGGGTGPGPATSGGPVHVRGYYRRDGTYVRPHSRRR